MIKPCLFSGGANRDTIKILPRKLVFSSERFFERTVRISKRIWHLDILKWSNAKTLSCRYFMFHELTVVPMEWLYENAAAEQVFPPMRSMDGMGDVFGLLSWQNLPFFSSNRKPAFRNSGCRCQRIFWRGRHVHSIPWRRWYVTSKDKVKLVTKTFFAVAHPLSVPSHTW